MIAGVGQVGERSSRVGPNSNMTSWKKVLEITTGVKIAIRFLYLCIVTLIIIVFT